MTLANLTRSLLFATAMLLLGAAAVSADEPDPGLLGGALGGAGNLVEAGGEVVEALPVEPLIDPVVHTVKPVIPAVVPPVVAPVVAPITQPVLTVIEDVAEPAAAVVAPVAAAAAPVVTQAVSPVKAAPVAPVLEPAQPVVERITKGAEGASRPLADRLAETAPAVEPLVDLVDLVAPAATGLSPVLDALAPAVNPLTPLIDVAEDIARPVVDPVIGAVRPLLGPAGLDRVLAPVVGPVVSVLIATSDPPLGALSTGVGEAARTSAIAHASAASGESPPTSARDTGLSNADPGGTAPAPERPLQVPGSMPSGSLVSAVDGGFAVLILASLLIALIASRSSLSAFRIARPPSLSFAPAVPPA